MALPDNFSQLPIEEAAGLAVDEVRNEGICDLQIGTKGHADRIFNQVRERLPGRVLTLFSPAPNYNFWIRDDTVDDEEEE